LYEKQAGFSELVKKSLSVWGGLPSPPGHAALEVRATRFGTFLHKFSETGNRLWVRFITEQNRSSTLKTPVLNNRPA